MKRDCGRDSSLMGEEEVWNKVEMLMLEETR
jgi:hypothetical protein